MNEKELEQLVETLMPYIRKVIKNDNDFKTIVRRKNATVINTVLVDGETNINQDVEVVLPYDTASFFVKNKTDEDLKSGDLICIEYCIDLKNAIAVYKVSN